MSNTKLNNRPFTVIVEGNIGSGKTTFLEHFKQFENVSVLAEPIDMWRNCNGYNLLDRMYKDPQTWSFTFQSYVQLTMLQQHAQRTHHPIKLIERSIYSARYCFVENMMGDGILSMPSGSVIDEWFKWAAEVSDVSVDLIVYLRTTPEVVRERIKMRNRNEEQSVPFEYLKQLHDVHEDWLYYKTKHHCPAPVIVLDANLDRHVIIEEYMRCQPHILEHVTV